MSGYRESRWHDDECCGNCASCLIFENNNERVLPLSKRYVTLGSVRYGVRLGAVSPPPPGAGPRYRSQCCWPSSTPGSVSRIPLLSGAASASPINSRDIFSCVNRVRMTEDAKATASTAATVATTTSELAEQQCKAVRDHLFNPRRFLLKTQLKQRPISRNQIYERVNECVDGGRGNTICSTNVAATDILHTLDRLPRFRFGGNRGTGSAGAGAGAGGIGSAGGIGAIGGAGDIGSGGGIDSAGCTVGSNKVRERIDKRDGESKLRELTDRLKRVPSPGLIISPVPPPRTRHMPPRTPSQIAIKQAVQDDNHHHPQTTLKSMNISNISKDVTSCSRNLPLRSASFSQLEYSTTDQKYVRKNLPAIAQFECSNQQVQTDDNYANCSVSNFRNKPSVASTLPRINKVAASSRSISYTYSNPRTLPIIELPVTITDRLVTMKTNNTASNIDDTAICQQAHTKDNNKNDASAATDDSTVLAECLVRNSERLKPHDKDSSNAQKRDKSRKRKGMYISQWPNPYQSEGDIIPRFVEDGDFASASTTSIASCISTEEPSAMYVPNAVSNQLNCIPSLQISSEQSDAAVDVWAGVPRTATPQEPLTPEEDNLIEWVSSTINRPTVGCTQTNVDDISTKTLITTNYAGSIPTLIRADSLSEGEHERDRDRDDLNINAKLDSVSFIPSDVSDTESRNDSAISPHIPRRYSKRPLRGPYGQMLEAEMKKPEAGNRRKNQYANDLKFLEDLSANACVDGDVQLQQMQHCTMVSLSSSNSVGAGDPKPKYVTRTRGASNHSLDDSQLKNHSIANTSINSRPVTKRKVSVSLSQHQDDNTKLIVSHQRTTSSPSKLEGFSPTEASNELLEQLLRGSSEQLAAETNLHRLNDTRTHVVVELYDTERSYVDSLQILVAKYLEPLKSPENAGLLEATLVDEIFFQIPSLLTYHQVFLEELKKRLEHWDIKQKVGDLLIDMFSNSAVIESYTNYVNNWKRARDVYKTAQQSKPAFARFLEAMAREHKGKLALDSLLIKPIQKFPKYELLLQRLIKHTDTGHPDHSLLMSAQREIHDQLLKINCTEREALELDQLREIEGLIEGLIELVTSDRQYLRHDLVSMAAGGSARKERALFLFSDLLLVTSIKRKGGTIRRPVTTHSHHHIHTQGAGTNTFGFDANKYKLLMKITLEDLDIVRAKDENLRQMMLEIDNLTEDITALNQITELTWSLHCSHTPLDELLKEMLVNMNKQLVDQQNSDSQLSCLDLTLNTPSGLENVSIVFSKPDKKASWEESFNEAKHKLAMSGDRRPCPELVATVPIRKTRAGLQFTCAAPTATSDNGRDVWVCNSDGYVGQVCVLSLYPEATVTSCNGVCNARILCVASVPGVSNISHINTDARELLLLDNRDQLLQRSCGDSITGDCDDALPYLPNRNEEHSSIQFDSSSSSDDDDRSENEDSEISNVTTVRKSAPVEIVCQDLEDTDNQQSTMWLGTEDGCIHVYNSSDNIRIKKNKIRLQHGSSILSIIYLENRVFVSLANGDIAIYERDNNIGGWNTNSPNILAIGTPTMPVSKMVPNAGKLWCGCGNTIKVLNTQTLTTESTFAVNNDLNKPITSIVVLGNGVWLSLQNSAIIKCFHGTSFEFLCEVNVALAVTKMLTSCDDIIRQHKAACLRVTSLLACKDLLWIGTSAGVLLTMPLPHITASTTKLASMPAVMGVPHGHTGHVRFLTHVESSATQVSQQIIQQQSQSSLQSSQHRHSYAKAKGKGKGKGKPEQIKHSKILIISGGDGYEDFRSSNLSEVAGREDSTNHLLLWNI